MYQVVAGLLTPVVIYLLITALHWSLPARVVDGYVTDKVSGRPLRYRLNGRRVLVASMVIWFAFGNFHVMPFEWLYLTRWYGLAGACGLGLVFTLWIVLREPATGRGLVADLFLGRSENPQFGDGLFDIKMWLYLVGAVMLELNVLSFAIYHYHEYGVAASTGIILCAAMLTFFVFDYLTFEEVHLYTYDIFAERVGFKLGWGCLAFYPYFYSVALWSTAGLPGSTMSVWHYVLATLVFLGGWSLARGANMQKFYFKVAPERAFLGIKPEAISDGQQSLLVNGFWGVSRHVNYLGEILMGSGIALSVAGYGQWWPWLYPLYYVALLVPRQWDDDVRCAAKYGELWQRYTDRVKYRIIPLIY